MTQADYDYYDRIFVMDRNNLRRLPMIGIEDKADKISLLMTLIGENRDVADPWYTRDFEKTYADLCAALPRIL